MTYFVNAIINSRHPEEARSAVSKDAYVVVQRLFPPLDDSFAVSDAGGPKTVEVHAASA
jgi:hypothetical protein